MGKISEYSQGKLASSAVGVANVRNTGVEERNAAVARVGAVVSGFGASIAAKEATEAAAARASANKIGAQKQAIEFQARATALRRTVRQEYADKPHEYEEAFRKDFAALQSGIAATIKDPDRKAQFTELTQSMYKAGDELAHATTQFKNNTLTDTARVIDMANDFSTPGSAPKDMSDMTSRIREIEHLVSSTGLPEEEFPIWQREKMLQESINKHVAAFANHQSTYGDPLAVAVAIEKGEFQFKYTLGGNEYSYSPYADPEVKAAKIEALRKKKLDQEAQAQFNREVAAYDLNAEVNTFISRKLNGLDTVQDHLDIEQEMLAVGAEQPKTEAESKAKSERISALTKALNPIVAHPKESDAQAMATGYTLLQKTLGKGGVAEFEPLVKALKAGGVPLSANPNYKDTGIFKANPPESSVKAHAELVNFLVESGHLLSQSEYDIFSQAANPYGVGLPDENKDKRYKLMYDLEKGTAPKFKLGKGEYTVNSSNVNQVFLAEGYNFSKDFGPGRKAEAEVFRNRFFRYAVTDLELHMKQEGGVSDFDSLSVGLQQQVLDTVLKDAYRQTVISITGSVPTSGVQIKPTAAGTRLPAAEQRKRIVDSIKALSSKPAEDYSGDTDGDQIY